MTMMTLDNPLQRGVRLPETRKIRLVENLKLPPGTVVVSADSHWEVAADIFYERVPNDMKEHAPRVWFDKIFKMGPSDGKGGAIDAFKGDILKIVTANTIVPGAHDLDIRRAHMDAEGIVKEINFPNFVLAFLHHPDFELREAIYRIYNEYMAERSAENPGRSYGVGILSNWWDPGRAKIAVQQIKDLGLRTFMLPLDPGKGRDGEPLVYSEPEMDAMWSAIEESGLPVCFHIGESSLVKGRGGWGIRVFSSISPFVKPLAQLIFGGIFDRNPGLRVAFVEGGISWVPTALQDAEMIYDSYPGLHDIVPKLRPTEYWARNCYATFMNDQLGLKLLDYIGVDRVMWSSDYPHCEGSFGYSQDSIQNVLNAVSAQDARKILGDNAIKLFGL
jgi:predicted TIM-barrel fold metal-dependent hydrolase